jgi:hypothetical protein
MQDWITKAKQKKVMPNNIVQLVGKQIIDNSDPADRKFLTAFIQTQLFNQYIEENSEFEQDITKF